MAKLQCVVHRSAINDTLAAWVRAYPAAGRRGGRRAVLLAGMMAVSACSSVSPDTVLVAAQPAVLPQRPLTPYSDALRCIHDQLVTAPTKPITLTVGEIPDATGRITPGLRDMITSAIADVASGSGHYELTELAVRTDGYPETIGVRPELGGALIGIGPVRQNSGLQMVGALTQADRDNQFKDVSAGVSYKDNVIDAARSDNLSTVALDLRLVDISNGLTITNTTRSLLAVRNHGVSANAAITVGSFGFSFDYSVSRQEGPHQAVRTLIELSVAELLSQAAHIPYWACMKVDRRNPLIQRQIARWFDAATDVERETEVRGRLRALGFRVPAPPASATDAILAFQQQAGLVPSGVADFETYAELLTRSLPQGATAASKADRPPPVTPAAVSRLPAEPVENPYAASQIVHRLGNAL